MDIARIRKDIPVTSNLIYMNTGWSGPSPSQVTRRIQEQLDLEMNHGPATSDTMARHQAIREELTGAVSRLLNASPDTIALTQRTTHGQTVVLNGMDWRAGDELVTCSLEHPSVIVPSLILQETHGVKVRIAAIDPKDDRETLLSKIEACIGQRTRLVFLSHIQYSCGLRLPVKEITQLAHERGALVLLDGAQTAGQITLDMEDMDCDFYSIPGQKWLLGPEGTGAVYLREELIRETQPRYPASGAVSQWSRDDGSVVLTPDSPDKFSSSPPSFALLAGMAEAIAFHQEVGEAATEARTLELAGLLKETLSRIPGISFTGPEEAELSCGLVTLAVAGKEPRQIVDALWERSIAGRQVTDPEGLRLCTAFFNTEEEIERVGEALGEIARG